MIETNRRVLECLEKVTQKELNDSSLLLALNGLSLSKPAKDLNLAESSGDRKILGDERSSGRERGRIYPENGKRRVCEHFPP